MTLNDSPPRILIVGDLPLSRGLMRMVLTRLDYIVLCVGTAKEAALALANTRFSIALIATRLPDTTGMAFGRQIRNGDIGEDQPPVILFGDTWDSAAIERECDNHGIQGFLNKPISISRLVESVRRWTSTSFCTLSDQDDAGTAKDHPEPSKDLQATTNTALEAEQRHHSSNVMEFHSRSGAKHHEMGNLPAPQSSTVMGDAIGVRGTFSPNGGHLKSIIPANLNDGPVKANHGQETDSNAIPLFGLSAPNEPYQHLTRDELEQEHMDDVIDLEHLSGFTGNDQQLEGELASLYVSTAKHYLEQMSQCLENGTTWDRPAHSLKGSSANIGAKAMAAIALEAEKSDPSRETIEMLKLRLDEVISFFERRESRETRHAI